MEKHYLFKTNKPIDQRYFFSALEGIGIDKDQVIFSSADQGEFFADSSAIAEIEPMIQLFHDDLSIQMSVLSAHQNTSFEQALLRKAALFFPNRVLYATDVIMKEISLGEFSSYKPLMNLFANVPYELLNTAGTYLRCGCDACLSARMLFIHRNTFNYRFNQFINLSGLDIRDYHNALLLELYFQLNNSIR